MDRMLDNLPALNWASFGRFVRNRVRVIFTRGDFTTLIITCLLLVIPVLALNTSLDISRDSIRQSGAWPVSLNQLVPIAIMSVIFGFFLARSHFSELFSLILSAIYCVATILVIQLVVAPGDPVSRLVAVIGRFLDSFQTSLHTNTLDPYVLVIFLSILIWFLGHNTAWHTFRLDRVWRAILPPGIVLVLNGFYNQDQSQSNIDLYLIVYVFLSLLLIIHSHVEAREFDWYMNRVAFQGNLSRLRGWFFRSGAILGLFLLLVAWLLPTGSTVDSAKRFQDFLNGDVMAKVTQLLNKLLGSLEGSGAPSVDYYGGDTLTLTGAIKLGDQPVMIVKAPPSLRYYWQSRVFDIYQGNQWSSPRSIQLTADAPGLELKYPPMDPSLRKQIDQRITIAQGSSQLVYGAPQPIKFDIPVQVDTDYVDPAAKTVNPSVTRPVTQLREGDSYLVTSSISIATANQLEVLPRDYPVWVRALDLQMPANITPRTRQLATKIIQDAKATTDYDKAKAIEQWLRANIRYNENIVNPPPNRELVDWVLFDQREGYCTYYASAMIIMLRSLGIPARMGAGFAQGVFDPVSQSYIVRESDAHTWVQVYFTQAGWVDFEPTSAQQSLDRPDSNARPTSAPLPSNTPTPTPSPTPSPTATQSGAVPPVLAQTVPPQAQQVTQTLTSTPTFTPLPSVTPTTPPIKVLEVPPTVRGGVTFLLVLIFLIAILSFVGVGLIWWVEYRGLDRVSPIGRAYARLAIYARWIGVPLNEASTPLERGRRIAREVPTGSRPVTTITDMYINERYAPPHNIPPAQEDQAGDAWRRARRAFIIRKIKRFFRRE